MSWAMVASTAITAGVGIYQTQQGKKLADQAGERPEYEIPESVKSALGSAQLKSLQGIPAAVKGQMLQEMDRSRMASLSQVNERRGGLGAISQLEQGTQDSIRQIGIMDIQQREKNVQGLQDMRMKYAGYEDKVQADDLSRWTEISQSAAAMKGAGMQNIAGAAINLGTAAAGGAFKKKDTTDTTDTTGVDAISFEGSPTSGVDRRTGVVDTTQLKTTIGGQNNQMIGGTGFTGGALNSQNYSGGQYNAPTSPFATGGGLSLQGQSKIDTSSLRNMGFNTGGEAYNAGITSNIGLSSALSGYEANNPPSLQNQLFGANSGGGQGILKQDYLNDQKGIQDIYGNPYGTLGSKNWKL